jgi:uncharacterized membrane protein
MGKRPESNSIKLSEADRKYIESALKKSQTENSSDPFSDSKIEPKPAIPNKVAAEAENAKPGVDETAERKATPRTQPAERTAEQNPENDKAPAAASANATPPQPAKGGMPLFVMMFLRFGFSGFLFGPLLLGGIVLMAIGLKNANRYY